ncbi:MAG: CDP-alcohol phosphatidyltransferase family protein [Nitrospirales bacterium]
MSLYVHIIGESTQQLWGLTSRERLLRMLKGLAIDQAIDDFSLLPSDSTVLLIHSDYIYDVRVLNSLLEDKNVAFQLSVGGNSLLIAAHVQASLAQPSLTALQEGTLDESLPLTIVGLQTLTNTFQKKLRKVEPPYVFPITRDNHEALEEHLYSGSYKGITDLITKWAWPIPAKWATRICAHSGIQPNHVTFLGLILTIIAGVCFSKQHYLIGLLAGWGMTFLDTVDGKLARVTVTSTKFGDIFDHGIDLIHPPLWYLAWGIGLTTFETSTSWPWSLNVTIWAIFIGYVVGRLIEGAFQQWVGRFGIYCWKPVDSYFRLITARRNPNLILLSGSYIIGRPDWGLIGVAFWTVASTLILFIRFVMALGIKKMYGEVSPWLASIGTSIDRESFTARLFTRPPFTKVMQSKD